MKFLLAAAAVTTLALGSQIANAAPSVAALDGVHGSSLVQKTGYYHRHYHRHRHCVWRHGHRHCWWR